MKHLKLLDEQNKTSCSPLGTIQEMDIEGEGGSYVYLCCYHIHTLCVSLLVCHTCLWNFSLYCQSGIISNQILLQTLILYHAGYSRYHIVCFLFINIYFL